MCGYHGQQGVREAVVVFAAILCALLALLVANLVIAITSLYDLTI